MMRDIRSQVWRFRRKITAAVLVCCFMYFIISIAITKRNTPGNDVQGSHFESFRRQAELGKRGGVQQAHHINRNASRKIHRMRHNLADGVRGVARQHHEAGGPEEDEFSSSSASSSADEPHQRQSETQASHAARYGPGVAKKKQSKQVKKGAKGKSKGKQASKPTKKLPQAIIIGVKKGGTRALIEFISLHPDIMAAKQEVHFFDRNYEKGLDWYRDQMPLTKPGQITIEKTPSYFITAEAPERISHLGQDTKFILVVRDPIVRALSDFAQSIATGRRHPGTFDRLAVPDPKTGIVDTDFYAVHVGLYDVHLTRWFKYFPKSQFLFLNSDALIKDPAQQLIKVQEFLNIDKVIDEQYFVFNATKGFYCARKVGESGEVKCLGDGKGRAHPQASPSVLRNLREFYKPHMEKFYEMIGENFHFVEEGDR